MKLKNEELFQQQKDINKDPYGARIVQYAEQVGDALEADIEANPGLSVDEVMDAFASTRTEELNTDRITGFMYSSSIAVLKHCWVHSDAISAWNKRRWESL